MSTYTLPEKLTAPRADLALAILRVALGVVFLAHGAQKIFVYGHAGVTGGFSQMGIPLPSLSAAVVMLVEFLGGLALILGVFPRVFAGLLTINMMVAMLLVHLKNGFFAPTGVELPLTLAGALAAVVLLGGGRYSVSSLWNRP